ncbi:sensor histidine kinase [Frondihabitans cladoniiphilus]|uniref:Histidine kinase/HSP90-like ATPase domain-containing protein n=1 Tax=Frondihabitans cladoniiphilus TaxID=715785 RepID=A0ABP8W4H1_9MICO
MSKRGRANRNPISGPTIERALGRAIAILSLVFGAQSVPFAVAQLGSMKPGWAWIVGIAIFGGLALTAVSGFTLRGFEVMAAFVSIAYFVALVTWSIGAKDPTHVLVGVPWLWYMCNLALTAAVVAFSPLVATVYLFVIPGAYAVIRVLPAGGAASPGRAALDSVYVLILGGAALILITLLRRAAYLVDAAQLGAIGRYADAVREHATEVERVQVDSIVHDSVLTTFLSAARAFSPSERQLSTAMARNTLRELGTVVGGPKISSDTSLASMRQRVRNLCEEIGVEVDLRSRGLDNHTIPSRAAEALYSAAIQALLNSVQHAGPGSIERWVELDWTERGVSVEVGDRGAGFDPSALSGERLGVRVSIQERLANAGGEAEIESAVGEGTVIRLQWPRLAA